MDERPVATSERGGSKSKRKKVAAVTLEYFVKWKGWPIEDLTLTLTLTLNLTLTLTLTLAVSSSPRPIEFPSRSGGKSRGRTGTYAGPSRYGVPRYSP